MLMKEAARRNGEMRRVALGAISKKSSSTGSLGAAIR